MSDLHPWSRALIDSAREREVPGDGEYARHRRALTNRVGAGVFTATTAAAVTKAAGAAAASGGIFGAFGKSVVAVAIAGAMAGGVAYGVHVHRQQRATSVATVETSPPTAVMPSAELIAPAAPRPAPPASSDPAPSPAATTLPRKTVVSSAARKTSGGSIADELVLIGAAQRALGDGNPALALELADKHAAQFPNGQLEEERAGVRVLAGCALGRPNAKAQAERFLRTRATSPIAAHVRKACGVP
jgi:hypothetical protein